jgi:hypothetical protein
MAILTDETLSVADDVELLIPEVEDETRRRRRIRATRVAVIVTAIALMAVVALVLAGVPGAGGNRGTRHGGSNRPAGGHALSRRPMTQVPHAVALVHVTARIPTQECAFEAGQGVHVAAAFVITSAELRKPSMSTGDPLSRQAPGSEWKLCYVTGRNVAPAFAPIAIHRPLPSPPPPHLQEAIYIFYRGGSIAEVTGRTDAAFKFIAADGFEPAKRFPWLRLTNRKF